MSSAASSSAQASAQAPAQASASSSAQAPAQAPDAPLPWPMSREAANIWRAREPQEQSLIIQARTTHPAPHYAPVRPAPSAPAAEQAQYLIELAAYREAHDAFDAEVLRLVAEHNGRWGDNFYAAAAANPESRLNQRLAEMAAEAAAAAEEEAETYDPMARHRAAEAAARRKRRRNAKPTRRSLRLLEKSLGCGKTRSQTRKMRSKK